MSTLKKGDLLKIHKYKHDGKIDRCWNEATFLDETDEYLVFANYKSFVIEEDGRTWRTKEPAIMYFSKKDWYNIVGQIKPNGIFYYCNIASPFIVEEGVIKYIDYDLDLRVFPNGSFKVLDRGEYRYNKKRMNYSKDLDTVLKHELTKLINKVRAKEFPFSAKEIDKYYKEYAELKDLEKIEIEV